MLITDPNELLSYAAEKRLWQGVPSIEITCGGRIFLTFYSGGTGEGLGNYSILIKSDDGGKTYSEPIAVAYEDGARCFDPCLWIDPLGRLWFTWARCPSDGVRAVICDDPDAENIEFGEEFEIGNNIMMNKPTVISTGEWLFPIAVWREGIRVLPPKYDSPIKPKGSYVYSSGDNGESFQKLGYADVEGRDCDEHMIVEMRDGSLRMFVRTRYGIGASNSYDGGKSWGADFDTGYGGPCSRFFIRRLKSGRLLLINHYNNKGRNNLYAMLSEDDGVTFPYKLLIDGRNSVSYPDAKEAEDGYIYITYDRERGGFRSSMEEVMRFAREVLVTKITEEDIIRGEIKSEYSYTAHIASKLTVYTGEDKNPYGEKIRYNPDELAAMLDGESDTDLVISEVFDAYHLNCTNIHNIDSVRLDGLIERYKEKKELAVLSEIITLVKSGTVGTDADECDIVSDIRKYITEDLTRSESTEDIALRFNYSANYLHHIFKNKTGTTIVKFRNEQRLIKAKILLRGCDSKITDIAAECGFENPIYFTEVFTKEVGISPREYRNIHKRDA